MSSASFHQMSWRRKTKGEDGGKRDKRDCQPFEARKASRCDGKNAKYSLYHFLEDMLLDI